MSANIAMDPSGLVNVNDIRVAAPLLRITSGRGLYRPNGTIDFRLAGVSQSYGPLNVHLTGTAARPQVRLLAANPGFGIGLRDVEAIVRATAGGWAIQATGQSAYGPFSADVASSCGLLPRRFAIRLSAPSRNARAARDS